MAALTGWSNDFKFENYVVREFAANVKKNDVLFLFSTSGGNFKKKQSINLIKLAKFAKSRKIPVISLLGKWRELKKISSKYIIVNS